MPLLIIYNMRVWHASRDIYHVACTLVHIFWKCVQKLHWKPMCLVLINLELNMHRSGLVSDELFYDKATCCSLSQAAAHHRTHARSVSSADLLSSRIWTSTRKTQKMHSRWVCVCTWRSQKNCTAGSLLLRLGCICSQYVGVWILPPVLWQNRWLLWRLLNRVRSKRLAMNSHASETPMHLLSRRRRRQPLVLWQIFTRGVSCAKSDPAT